MNRKFHFLAGMCGLLLASPLAAQDPAPPTEAELKLAYKKMDLDHDGIVTIIDYLGKKKGTKEAKAKDLFAKMDKNKDGFLMFDEYKAYMLPKPKRKHNP